MLQMSQNKVIRKIFIPKRDEVEPRGYYLTQRFVIYTCLLMLFKE
jgi:hypothetical protein